MLSNLNSFLKTRGRRQFQILAILVLFSLTLGVGTVINQSNEGVFPGLSTENVADWRIWKIKDSLLSGSSNRPSSFLSVPATDETCVGFDPASPWEQDPPGCLRARQYRQVERVLARERLAKHDHWYFTRPHNTATLEKLLDCFSTYPSPCPPRPLIISGWWYTAEVTTRGTSGEVIWQKGIMKFVDDLGLGFIAVGPYTNWITVAEMMPDVYRVLWGSDVDIVTCVTDPRCVAEYTPPIDAEDLSLGLPEEERGVIPIWALNVVDYWGAKPLETANNDYWWGLTEHGEWSYQPLGQQWIATPWPLPGHVHLPYSIEEYCLPLAVTPHEERNNSVLILAKRSAYFDYHFLSPKTFWTQLSQDPEFDLLTTAKEEEGHPIPEGLISLGHKSRGEYEQLVGSVKVLLGIGAPSISPSVYTALCQATPVIVAYFVEEPRTDGWHLYSGHLQHGPAQMIGPPYVYSYYSGNYTQMSEAVHTAINTPIERYIPPEMKYEYGLEQMRKYLDRDPVKMYERVLADNGGEVPRLIKHVRERCYELKRCQKVFPPGRLPSSPPKMTDLDKTEMRLIEA